MSQFSGRTLDLLALAPPADGAGAVSFEFPQKLTAGPQKAAQRFVHMLLTRRGTVKADPTFGTTFLAEIQSTGGSAQSGDRARSVFQRAVGQLLDWDRDNADQLSELEDDERVLRADVTSVAVLDDSVSFAVRLELAARAPVTYIRATMSVPRG